jgi:hypothetical protein
MTNLERRLERLEQTLTLSGEPRVIIVTINPDDLPEDPYMVQLSSVLWAIAARGGPFTAEEIKELREEESK